MSPQASIPGLVVFRAAAGPRIGFGHLIRSRSLARALGVRFVVSLRGGHPARRQATALGATLVDLPDAAALADLGASLAVIDDPSSTAARQWLSRARRAGVPVASVHDLGAGYLTSDLVIDGTIRARIAGPSATQLTGTAYAILDPALARARRRGAGSGRPRILIALGGGQHVLAGAPALAAALARQLPDSDLRIAIGFSATTSLPALPFGRWIEAPRGLARELASADAAIVAGGMSVYEACACGVPTVAVAVNAAQHATVRGLARVGAVIDGGRLTRVTAPGIGVRLARLLRNPSMASAQVRAAQRIVDGRGAHRVAARLRVLARPARTGARHAA